MSKRKISSATKTVILVCAILLVLNVITGVILMSQSGYTMKTLIRRHMLSVAVTASEMINGDELETITAEDVGSDTYNRIASTLLKVKDSQNDFDIKYIYIVKREEDHYVYLLDPDPVDPAEYGDEVVNSSAQDTAWSGTAEVDSDAIEDEWGCFYTAWSPVKNSDGQVVGMVGVDFAAEWYDKQISQHTVTVVIVSCLSLLATGLIMILMNWRVNKRFRELDSELSILSDSVENLTLTITTESGDDVNASALINVESDSNPDMIKAISNKLHRAQEKLSNYMKFVQRQAYTDSMTGVGNKTAYLEHVQELRDLISMGTADFAIAVFDVNGLKKTNDMFGHECGDRIIVDSSRIICTVFGKENVYRIGGDEFIAVLDKAREDELKEGFNKLEEEMKEFNEKKTYAMTLSFSGGWAIYRPGEDASYREVFKRADQAMYDNKDEFYSSNGGK